MSRTRYKIFNTHYPHFTTSTIVDWLPLFTNPEVVQIILDSLKFMQEQKRLTLFAYVIMENHLHMVVSSPNLASELGKFKSFTARSIIDLYQKQNRQALLDELKFLKLASKKDREHQFWQEGNHPKQICSEEMMRQKVNYTHQNPVRRGYVDLPEHWRYSSARNYMGQPGLLDICREWFY